MILATACGTPKRDPSVLRTNLYEYPRSFDPRKAPDPISFTMMYMLFEGLVRLEKDGSLKLAQAEKIEISPDKKTYTFHLGDHRWSNGKKVTAHDYASSWKDILNPVFPSLSAHLLYPIKNGREAKSGKVSLEEVGIRVIDDQTLCVELEEPVPYFLQIVANCSLFPIPHAHDRAYPQWEHADGKNFVGNGPFVLTKAVMNQEVIVTKNNLYRGHNKAKLKKIVFSILSDDMSALNLFASDGLDLIAMPLTRFPLSYLKTLKEESYLGTDSIAANLFCAFNGNRFPMNNVNIRKALAYSIDRAAIVNHISQLDEEIALRVVPPILRGGETFDFFQDDLKLARHHFKMGLEELGIRASELGEIELLSYPHEITQRVALAIQQQWKKAFKIDVQVKTIPFNTLMDKVHKEEHQVGLFAWIAEYYDPMSFFNRYSSKEDPKNYARWQSPEFTALLMASSHTHDEKERKQLLRDAEQLFVDQMPIAPIYHWKFPSLMKSYVKGFSISPLGQIYFSDVWIDIKDER